MSQHQSNIANLLREIVAYCREAGHEWSSLAEAEAALATPAQARQAGDAAFIANNLASMIVEWVGKCPDMTGNWQPGLASIIQLRLQRLFRTTPPAPAQPAAQPCVIAMGHGLYEVGAGTNLGLPCIAFGKNGTGVVGQEMRDSAVLEPDETHAVITFANVAGLDVLQEKVNEVRAHFFPDSVAQPVQGVPDAYAKGIEAAASLLTRMADEYALEHGHDDLGSLSFGSGPRAEAKMEWHSSLIELADEIRRIDGASPTPPAQQGEPTVVSQLSDLVRMCPDIECGRKRACTRIPNISCMSRHCAEKEG